MDMPTWPTGYEKPWLRLHLELLDSKVFCAHVRASWYKKRRVSNMVLTEGRQLEVTPGFSGSVAARQPCQLKSMYILPLITLLYYMAFIETKHRFISIVILGPVFFHSHSLTAIGSAARLFLRYNNSRPHEVSGKCSKCRIGFAPERTTGKLFCKDFIF